MEEYSLLFREHNSGFLYSEILSDFENNHTYTIPYQTLSTAFTRGLVFKRLRYTVVKISHDIHSVK
jgi:hypothetical protein